MAQRGSGGPIRALGAVLDGADLRVALVESDGARLSGLGPLAQAALAPDDPEGALAGVLAGFDGVDIIGLHAEQGPLPFDTRLVATALSVPVVSDFAGADLRLGGAGGPLTPFFHHAWAGWRAAGGPVMFVDLGEVLRVSWADPAMARPEQAGACLAFDAGPGCASVVAGGASDEPDEAVLARLLGQAHFARLPPRWIEPREFAWLPAALAAMPPARAQATQLACIALAFEDALTHLPRPPERVVLTGPGRRVPLIRATIAGLVACPVAEIEAVGLDDNMVQAQAIAQLAVRVSRGLATTCPTTTGVAAAVGGGEIAWPET
ncbi:anhydro-N-acetylmuramic acid kinase [Oceaniglobus trochenteri]|uniref:anhydro-N-acetylmuramic acid kinase n=1 Tax=Oceaniglobus trochenteri TaxID=2763260 RepID=UPI001CFF566B|nr:anhydro-N-acetylmuramic acid kinase [Oceaniglobus trochenteri]